MEVGEDEVVMISNVEGEENDSTRLQTAVFIGPQGSSIKGAS